MRRKENGRNIAAMGRIYVRLKTGRIRQRDHANHGETVTDIGNDIVGVYNSMRLRERVAQ